MIRALQRGDDKESRRLEWLGGTILAGWSAMIIKGIQDVTEKTFNFCDASEYLNQNSTLLAGARQWLHPRMKLSKQKYFELTNNCKDAEDTPAELVEALIDV